MEPPSQNKYSGLAPQKGWPGRNARFLRHRIVPGMFRRMDGVMLEPVLTAPEGDKVRITWIGHASFFLQFAGNSVVVDPNWAKVARPGETPAPARPASWRECLSWIWCW